MPEFEITINQAAATYRAGDANQAMDDLHAALKVTPDIWELWQTLGVIAVESGALDQGIEALSRAAILQPLNDTRYEELANSYILKEDLEKATECMTSAIALSPSNQNHLLTLNKLQHQLKKEKISNKDPQEQALTLVLDDKLFSSLETMAGGKKYFELTQFASNHEAEKTTDVRIHYILAIAYEALSQFDNVIKHLNFVTSAMPAFTKAFESLGDYLVMNSRVKRLNLQYGALIWGHPLTDKDDITMAILAYNKALKHNPRSFRCRLNFGNLNFYLGNFDKAEKLFQEVLRDKPNAAIVRFNLARVHECKHNYREAHNELSQCLKLNPNFQEAIEALARIEIQLKKPEVAASNFLRALLLPPTITSDLCK